MKTRVRILLPLILGGIYFLMMGATILQTGGNGEGFAFSVLYFDLPLLVLCQHSAVCGTKYYGLLAFILLAGTLMYAIAGFVIGAVIDWIRALIARRWGHG